jgi:hypothetical protein
MASYGNERIGWKKDQRDAAVAAMEFLIENRDERRVDILRWDGVTESRPDQKVRAFRLERLDGSPPHS